MDTVFEKLKMEGVKNIIAVTTCLFGFGEDFYCGPFCFAGKVVLGISAIFFGYLLYPDLKSMCTSKKT